MEVDAVDVADAAARVVKPTPPDETTEIHVCQSGSCRRNGAEAVLLEIEELANSLPVPCTVHAVGCVGACSEAPNAIVVKKRGRRVLDETLHTRLEDVKKSAVMVHKATGQKPALDDPAVQQRLTKARQLRVRQQARDDSKWNVAMAGMAEQIACITDEEEKFDMQWEHAQLCTSAGQCEQALSLLTELEATLGRHPMLLQERAKCYAKLGWVGELSTLIEETSNGSYPHLASDLRARLKEANAASEANAAIAANAAANAGSASAAQPLSCRIDGYAVWELAGVTPVSQHSAVYRLTSSDRKRGTPYTRGKGRTMWHKTWHTTMLAQVGPNAEGPLPYIERDYTPLSTWREWEQGTCDILIKIYHDGAATSWLHRQPIGAKLWLSQPRKTLQVPSLATDSTRLSNAKKQHSSVLLILGGTGVVAAPQVLHHTDPTTCFGTSAHASPPLKSPVSLIFGCRRDDVLLLSELANWCAKAGASTSGARLRRCVLAVSPPQGATGGPAAGGAEDAAATAAAPLKPFPEAPAGTAELDALKTLANVSVVDSRVTSELLEAELAALRSELGGVCRVVVSGPEAFNGAVKGMLVGLGVDVELVTILEA